jgi:hypothetical protein
MNMNKEIVIHAVIGVAAVAVIYWLYSRVKAVPVSSDTLTNSETSDMNAGTSLDQTQASTWWGIIASGGDYGQSAH